MTLPASSSVLASDRSRLRVFGPLLVILTLLVALSVATHFRFEYSALTLFFAALVFVGPRSRRFAWLIVPLLAVGVMYDQLLPRLLPFRPEVHVADLFHAELALFGVQLGGHLVIPAEWLAQHTHAILDFLCGFAYMTYMFETFVVVAVLYLVRDVERTARLTWSFLVVNVIGQGIWLLWPAAPPWYVAAHGLGPADFSVLPSAAGAARFDALVGWSYFQEFYARSRNVFGAMPSLHAAYPVVVLLAVWTIPRRWVRLCAAAFGVLVAFAAVYLYHHYVLDVVAGVAVGIVAYVLVWWKRRS
jgi:hypothetical protein